MRGHQHGRDDNTARAIRDSLGDRVDSWIRFLKAFSERDLFQLFCRVSPRIMEQFITTIAVFSLPTTILENGARTRTILPGPRPAILH